MEVNITKPRPTPNPITQPFWEAARDGKLLLQQCGDCMRAIHYPRQRCPHCWSDALSWKAASGRGKVASYTIAHRPGHPAFIEDAPYIIALIDLEEGPRMLSNIVGCPLDAVRVGMPVMVHWKERAEYQLPFFRPSVGNGEIVQ